MKKSVELIEFDEMCNIKFKIQYLLIDRVITGIRIKKINQIIHMQIQEGQLLPRGAINTSTTEWQPVDAFSIMDANIRSGIDYHKLVWEKRALDLDDLQSSQDHLLTGNLKNRF